MRHFLSLFVGKAMLQASGVSSTMKWPEVMRTCAQERAWNALKTPGERKQCWAEFQTKLMKEEKARLAPAKACFCEFQ